MSHAHTLIRTAAVAALTGLASSAARVYANRMHVLDTAHLPGLRVFLNEESVDHAVALQSRTVQLVVECCARAGATLDATCDQMQLEVEQALAPGLTVSSKTLKCRMTASRYDFEEAATPVGIKRLFFEIDFYTLPASPDSLT